MAGAQTSFRFYDNSIERLNRQVKYLKDDLLSLTKSHLALIRSHDGKRNLSLGELEAMIQSLEDRFPDV